MKITRISSLTGKENTLSIDVTEEQLQEWKNGTLIQNAMPQISTGEREFIKSGITPEEWDTAFA